MTAYDFDTISNTTHLVPYSSFYKIDKFDCGINEYNSFLLEDAKHNQEIGISNTQLLLDNKSGDVIGYFSLCMSSIKLTPDEKSDCGLQKIPFSSLPSLKIGKLAISSRYRSIRKGYGSYLIQLIRGIASELNENGAANRFIVVDADLQYDSKTCNFYEKNHFKVNESFNKKAEKSTISMRLDFFNDEIGNEETQSQAG